MNGYAPCLRFRWSDDPEEFLSIDGWKHAIPAEGQAINLRPSPRAAPIAARVASVMWEVGVWDSYVDTFVHITLERVEVPHGG